jgi:AraC family transcriptional regulator
MSEISFPGANFTPSNIIRRQSAAWRGLGVDVIQAVEQKSFEYEFHAPYHLLIAIERAERSDGETIIDGTLRSNRREYGGRLTFAPAGMPFHGWQAPRVLTRATYFYIDPKGPLVSPELRFAEIKFEPRLFFEHSPLWETTFKLKRLAESAQPGDAMYAEALSVVLANELIRLNAGVTIEASPLRGGLAAWQQKEVTEYINAHVAESISLADLARTARLSPFHFSRAFKQSFGMPPHRYHMQRRIEHAQSLLAAPALSVTEIGMRVGFSDSSSFTASFRRMTGHAPSTYRRSVA